MWAWLWGDTSAVPKTVDSQAIIEKSLDSVDALHAKRMHLLKKSSDLFKEAKELKKNGASKRAMACMKRRQQIDTMAAQLEGQILNMEKTSFMLESTATTVDLAKTMKDGSETMQNLLKEVSVDDIETIADNLDDVMISSNEVSQALARPLGGGAQLDSDEEQEMMNELDSDDGGEDILAKLPSVTFKEPKSIVIEKSTAPLEKNE